METYWFNGEPYQGLRNSATQTGGNTYWFNGEPYQFLIPNGVVQSSFFMVF